MKDDAGCLLSASRCPKSPLGAEMLCAPRSFLAQGRQLLPEEHHDVLGPFPPVTFLSLPPQVPRPFPATHPA